MRLQEKFFLGTDVISIAHDLIGKSLFTIKDGQLAGGIIIETEAYKGIEDHASHAFGGKRTLRNEMMYAKGGCIYVFLCYGIHNMLNVVTNEKDIPDAILVRSIFPTHGEELMLKRSGKSRVSKSLADGPGKVAKVLGISLNDNGASLASDMIWIEDRSLIIQPEQILATPRIGVDYAGNDALLPYRFVVNDIDSFINVD